MITRFKCESCEQIKTEIWLLCDDHDGKNCESCRERSKREEVFVYRPEKYDGPIAIDATPSKECREYHENSLIQVGNRTMRCSEHCGNTVREVQ